LLPVSPSGAKLLLISTNVTGRVKKKRPYRNVEGGREEAAQKKMVQKRSRRRVDWCHQKGVKTVPP